MSHLNNRPVRWQRSSTYNHPFLFVIPSVRWAFGPPKVMKNFTGNYFLWSRFHFLVIPTGAKRRGGTCGSADPSLRCFSTERSRGICGAPFGCPTFTGLQLPSLCHPEALRRTIGNRGLMARSRRACPELAEGTPAMLAGR